MSKDNNKPTRKQVEKERDELERIAKRDQCESDAFLKQNKKVADLSKQLPWWKR